MEIIAQLKDVEALSDLKSTLEELRRLDALAAELKSREDRLEKELEAECLKYHSQYYGTKVLDAACEDVQERLMKFASEASSKLQDLVARTGGLTKDIMARQKEQEEQNKIKVRKEAMLVLKSCTSEFRKSALELIDYTRRCLQTLMPHMGDDMLQTVRSEQAIGELVNVNALPNALNPILPPETASSTSMPVVVPSLEKRGTGTQYDRLIELNIHIRSLITQIKMAKDIIRGKSSDEAPYGSIEDVTDELDQLDVDHADVVVAQSFNICRVLLVHVLKKDAQTPNRIPSGLIELFSRTRNENRLIQVVHQEIAEAKISLAVLIKKENYYFDQIASVTNSLKMYIDRYYNVIYSQGALSWIDSFLVFQEILQKHRQEAVTIYSTFERDVLSKISSVSLALLHPVVNECLLIYANTNSVLKSLAKRRKAVFATNRAALGEESAAPTPAELLAQLRRRKDELRIDLELPESTELVLEGSNGPPASNPPFASNPPVSGEPAAGPRTGWINLDQVSRALIQVYALYIRRAWESSLQMDDCGVFDTEELVCARDGGSTLVDDIFYVLKEAAHHMLALRTPSHTLRAFFTSVEEILAEIPRVLSRHCDQALELYLSAWARPEGSKCYTRVTKQKLLQSTPGSDKLTTQVSMPHALMSIYLINQYLEQVQDKILADPATENSGVGGSSAEGTAAGGTTSFSQDDVAAMPQTTPVDLSIIQGIYWDGYDSAVRSVASRMHNAFLEPLFTEAPFTWETLTVNTEREEVLVQRLEDLRSYVTQVWASPLVADLLYRLVECVVSCLVQLLLDRISLSGSVATATSAGTAPSGGSTSRAENSTASLVSYFKDFKSSTETSTHSTGITCQGALEFDSLARHLIEWTSEALPTGPGTAPPGGGRPPSVRDMFTELVEMCELLTVESSAEVFDLCTSTKWTVLTQELATRILNARKIDLKMPEQLPMVIASLASHSAFSIERVK